MSNTLSVRVTSRTTTEGERYEGTIYIKDCRPTKLVRRVDNTTQFPTRSAVLTVARNVAKAHGYSDVNVTNATTTGTTTPSTSKKAAKKSPVVAQAAVKTATKPNTTNTTTVNATKNTSTGR